MKRPRLAVSSLSLTRAAALVLSTFGATVSGPTYASTPDAPPADAPRDRVLSLAEVLDSVESTHPSLAAQREEQGAASAYRRAARGAFDPKLKVKAELYPSGYYDYDKLDSELTQDTSLWGLQLYAGYRYGRGDIPDYKGELETLSQGELRAGATLPLWQGRSIDSARATLRQSAEFATSARCEVESVRLEVRRKASWAYWKWVAAGRLLNVARALLSVAEARDYALNQEVQSGRLAAIALVDNKRQVLQRQSNLIDAQRAFETASLDLSLFLRSQDGTPIRIGEQGLPADIPETTVLSAHSEAEDIATALRERPELCSISAEVRAAEVELQLKDNEVAPRLDVGGFVARDLGNGSPSLAPTEVGVALSFELPLALRKARGQRDASAHKLRSKSNKARGLRDAVTADVLRARVALKAAVQMATLAGQQREAQEMLAEAERDRFAHGASDLFRVNLRELDAASAASKEIKALAAAQGAAADLLAALGYISNSAS